MPRPSFIFLVSDSQKPVTFVHSSTHPGKFDEDTVIDIMRTHPMLIIGGVLQRNPFFVPPGEFRREFHERRAGRSISTSAGS
jgi:hypothetical protein